MASSAGQGHCLMTVVVAKALADVLSGGATDVTAVVTEDQVAEARAQGVHRAAAHRPDPGAHGTHARHRQAAQELKSMPAYKAPLRRDRFVLDELLKAETLSPTPPGLCRGDARH